MRKKEIIFLVLILILATVLRVYNLENKYYGTDEKHSLLQGDRIINNLSIETLKKDAHPPLFFGFVGLLKKLVGSEYVMRLIFVLISLVIIIIFYFITKSITNTKIATTSALIMATSPFYILYSHHIRVYLIQFLLFIISTHMLYKFLFKNDKKSIYYLTIINIISFYSHLFSSFYILAQFITVIYFKYKYKIQYFKEYLISTITSGIVMALWIPIFIKQYIFIIAGDKIAIQPFKWYFLPYPFYKYTIMVDVKTVLSEFPQLFIISLLITGLFFYGIYKFYKTDKKLSEFLMLCFFPAFIVMGLLGMKFKIYSFRYLSYFFPIYVIFLANGLELKQEKYKILILIIIIASWLFIMNYYYSVMHIKLWNELFAI